MMGAEQHVAPKPRAGGADAQARDPAGGVEKGHDHRRRPADGAIAEMRNDQEQQRQHHCGERSEEHTSELQSLMRISYAVSCLIKKKTTQPYSIIKQHTNQTL